MKLLSVDHMVCRSTFTYSISTWANKKNNKGLISLIELPEDTNVPDDEHFIEIEDTPGERCRETDT
jgi:hypothetical protein